MLKNKKNHGRVGPRGSHRRQDGGPGAHHPGDVLDGVLVPGIEVSPRRKVLPVVVLVDQGVQKGHVQHVVQGCVTDVQNHKHHPEGADRVDNADLRRVQRDVRRKPDVVAQPLDEDPFVDRVDGQKDDGLNVEVDVPDRLPRGSGRQVLLAKEGIHRVYHEVVVEVDRQADGESPQDPLLRAQVPRVEESGVFDEEYHDGTRRATIENRALDALL
mmetsp:Transcript_36911/g.77472  ORF Transcript_36911/g.77472 Transcript_36911/m.77472 type:complete len:215 (-) Transcript_36911:246-890(-)